MTTTLRRTLAALASLAAFAAPAAETIGVVAVADPPGPTADLVEITVQFRAVLAERTPGVLDANQLRERMTGQTSTASLSELDRAFAGALATYQSGDYEGAIRTLRAVIDDLEKLPDSDDAFRLWSKAMLRLARAEQTVGRRAEAQALLERLARADPKLAVDLNQYPPSFAKQVDEVKGQMRAKPQRRLTVNAGQRAVKVFIDGREVGTTPLTLGLAPGRYRVSGSAQAIRVPGVYADLSEADQVVNLDLSLAEALRPAAGPGLALGAADRARRIVTAGAFLGLDRAIAAVMVSDGDTVYLQGTVYDVRKGSLQREGRVRLSGRAPPPGGLAALAGFLMTGTTSPLVAGVAAAVPVPPPPAGRKPDLRPPERSAAGPVATRDVRPAREGGALKWAPVATGVVALGAGAFAVIEALAAKSKYSDADALILNGQLKPGATAAQYNALVKDGNSARDMAMYSGIGAGVALVATGVLGYLSYQQSGEVGPFRF
jgi:tetratricopeptide (TPR) repeat protein